MKNKIFTFLLIFIFIFTGVAKAEDKEIDYEYINSGNCVNQDGFFFSQDGMSKLYVNIEEKVKISCLEKQKQINLCNLDLNQCSKSKQIELGIQKEMFEKQLLVKQQVIDSYKNQSYWSTVKTVGGFVLGLGVGYAVTKLFLK